MRKNTPPKADGFTLIEIIVVIALTAIIMVTIFQALHRVKLNELKFERQREDEKDIYFLFTRLTNLFKNTSSLEVFNNREFSVYFRGAQKGMIFLSRVPLISPYGGVYFIEIRFEKNVILYREKPFRGKGEGDFISFDELAGETFYPLLDHVENVQLQYYLWDKGEGDFLWKREVNAYEKDPLPLKVWVHLVYGGQAYDMIFPKVIKDKNEQIPADLFK